MNILARIRSHTTHRDKLIHREKETQQK